IRDEVREPVKELREKLGVDNDYEAYLFLEQPESLTFLSPEQRTTVDTVRSQHKFFPGKFQGAETIQRFGYIQNLLNEITLKPAGDAGKKASRALDKILTHMASGYMVFFVFLALFFPSILACATVPLDCIDGLFANLSGFVSHVLPAGPL